MGGRNILTADIVKSKRAANSGMGETVPKSKIARVGVEGDLVTEREDDLGIRSRPSIIHHNRCQ